MTDAEQNYLAIEGEAFVIAWALEQSKYFTLGYEDMLVVTDHKPLVPIIYIKDLNPITGGVIQICITLDIFFNTAKA